MDNWKKFERPTVFISASCDMDEEAAVCLRVVENLSRDHYVNESLEAFSWSFADHPWTGEETYQNQIPRTSDPMVKAIICIFGERIGHPLRPEFTIPQDLALPDWVAHPWPKGGIEGKVPLTGTLFEFFDALSRNPEEGRKTRLLIYIKADQSCFNNPHLDAEDRRYGLGNYYDRLCKTAKLKKLKRADQSDYDEQIDWLDVFVRHCFRSNLNPCKVFGQEQAEASLNELNDLVLKDLRLLLNMNTPKNRRDPKSLSSYQPEDWDILFGRDNDIRAIFNQLKELSVSSGKKLPILFLTGQSGQGKSSVLRAGLVGRLRQGDYKVFGQFRPVLLDASLFSGSPLLELADGLLNQGGVETISVGAPLKKISLDEQPLEILRRVRQSIKAKERLFIALDQAESLLLSSGQRQDEIDKFISCIVSLAENKLAFIVVAITQEHKTALDELFTAKANMAVASHSLGDPDRITIEKIVREVFDRAEITPDIQLVQNITQQAVDWLSLEDSPGAVMPLLSVLLSEIVDKERSGQESSHSYFKNNKSMARSAPKLAAMLDALGEKAWIEMEKKQSVGWRLDEQFSRLMRQLVTTVCIEGEPHAELKNCPMSHPAVEYGPHIHTAMRLARLLLSPASNKLRLAHRAVVNHWSRAEQWYNENRKHFETLEKVVSEAKRWSEADLKNQDSLLETRRDYIDMMEGLWSAYRNDDLDLLDYKPLDYMRACLNAFFDPAGNPGSELNKEGACRLAVAISTGDKKLVSAYKIRIDKLERKDQIRIVTLKNAKTGGCAIFDAARYGDPDLLKWLIERGADVNHIQKDGQTPLHYTAYQDCIENARTLVESGARIDLHGKGQYTPLDIADFNGSEQVAAFLLEKIKNQQLMTCNNLENDQALLEQKLKENEKLFGPEHPVTLASMYTLAELLRSKGEGSKAQELFEKAKTIKNRALGSGKRLDVFLCANSKDYEFAETIYDFLVKGNLSVFFSKRSLPQLGSANYVDEIDKAIEKSRHMVVVASSRENVEGEWVKFEWGSFINEMRAGRKKGNVVSILVGMMSPDQLPFSLRQFEVVSNDQAGLNKLISFLASKTYLANKPLEIPKVPAKKVLGFWSLAIFFIQIVKGLIQKKTIEINQSEFDVFISANNQDLVFAGKLYDFLVKENLSVFFSKKSLPELGSAHYADEIDKAIEKSRHMVVVASSRENVEGKWVQAEWGSFINEMRCGRKKGNLITILTDSMNSDELPLSLRQYTVIPYKKALLGKLLPYLQKL